MCVLIVWHFWAFVVCFLFWHLFELFLFSGRIWILVTDIQLETILLSNISDKHLQTKQKKTLTNSWADEHLEALYGDYDSYYQPTNYT